MKWSDVGKKIAEVAPLLGGVVGGPAGGAIGSMVASIFGVKNEPDAIMEAIKTNPKSAIMLKELELSTKVRLQEIAMEVTKSEIADKQSARKENKHSFMPAVLSCALTVFVMIIVYALFYLEPPEGAREVLFMLLGVVIKEWSNSLHYWFGTTRSSQDKTLNLK